MAVAIKLPRMSDTMEEGTLVSWQVKLGDKIKSGDILAEVETDKATMDLENYENGTVIHLAVNEGDTVPVESIIAVIGEPNEDFAALLTQGANNDAKSVSTPSAEADKIEVQESSRAPQQTPTENFSVATPSNEGRVFASPLAKKIAEEKGIDLSNINGSGDNGRIIKKDVESYTPAQTTKTESNPLVGQESYTDVPVTQMRKTIARRLGESKFTAPHFYLTLEIKMDNVIAARKQMNSFDENVKISVNDLIIKACAIALKSHPMVNAAWMGDKIRMNNHVHIGVAVAVEDGLLVPVIRFADAKSLSTIGNEVRILANKAKNKELQPKDWEGNTFTISNLGMFGIDEFTAIINPPDACILAVGGIKETVIVENGVMKPGNIMKVTLSCDHRVVDGVTGSKFLQTVKGLLEEPVRLLI